MDFTDFIQPKENFNTPSKRNNSNKGRTYNVLDISKGYGNIHANHFIAYFNGTVEESFTSTFEEDFISPHRLKVSEFLKDFVGIFNGTGFRGLKDNIVTVQKHGSNIYEFQIEKFIGLAHSDYVEIKKSKDENSFYARTLERKFLEQKEELSQKVPDPYKVPSELIEINKMHFLSGRRSWKVKYDKSTGIGSVETAALEKNSHELFDVMERILNTREDINKLWSILLYNFLKARKLRSYINPDLENYSMVIKDVYFKKEEFESVEKAKDSEWFSAILLDHPGLIE